MYFKKYLVVATVGLLALTGCSSPTVTEENPQTEGNTTEQPVVIEKVRVNVPGHLSDAPILIAESKGYFADLGIELEISRSSAPASIPLLASDQLDVSGGAVGAGFYNSIESNVNVKIVGDKGSFHPDTLDYQALVVAPEYIGATPEETIQNLKGEVIGLNSTASAVEVAVSQYLEFGGLTVDDVELSPMDGPSQLTALTNGAVAAVDALEPALSQMVKTGAGEVVITPTEAGLDDWQLAVLMYGQAFAEKEELATKFMNGYLQGARDYYVAFFGDDPQLRAEVIEILIETTTVTNPEMYEILRYPFIDPNGKVGISSLEEQQQYFVDHGHMSEKYDLADIVDTSFATNAVAQLGGEFK